MGKIPEEEKLDPANMDLFICNVRFYYDLEMEIKFLADLAGLTPGGIRTLFDPARVQFETREVYFTRVVQFKNHVSCATIIKRCPLHWVKTGEDDPLQKYVDMNYLARDPRMFKEGSPERIRLMADAAELAAEMML